MTRNWTSGFHLDGEPPCPPDHPWYNANTIDWSAFDPTLPALHGGPVNTTAINEGGYPAISIAEMLAVPRVAPDLALAARAVNKREIEDAGLGTPIKRTGRRLNRGRRGSLGVLREHTSK